MSKNKYRIFVNQIVMKSITLKSKIIVKIHRKHTNYQLFYNFKISMQNTL